MRIVPMIAGLSLLALASPAFAATPCETVETVWDGVAFLKRTTGTEASPDGMAAPLKALAAADFADLHAPPATRAALESFRLSMLTAESRPVVPDDLPELLRTLEARWNCVGDPSQSDARSLEGSAAVGEGPGAVLEGRNPALTGSALSAAGRLSPSSSVSSGLTWLDWGALIGLVIALIALPVFLYRRAQSPELRVREARHLMNKRIAFLMGGHMRDGVLLDLSMNGFKLRHDGGIETDARLSLSLDGRWYDGQVRWHNDRFAGGRFLTPIPKDTIDGALEDAFSALPKAPQPA